MGDVADDGIEQGGEGGEFVELAGAGGSGFDSEDEGEGLGGGVLFGVSFKGEVLGDAVVGEEEVVGGEGEDEVAGAGADEGGDEDEVRVRGEMGRLGGLLRGAGSGELRGRAARQDQAGGRGRGPEIHGRTCCNGIPPRDAAMEVRTGR